MTTDDRSADVIDLSDLDDTRWFEISDENVPRWAIRMFQDGRTGRTLSLESNSHHHPGRPPFKVVVLPEDYQDDNQVLSTVGEFETKEDALEAIRWEIAGEGDAV